MPTRVVLPMAANLSVNRVAAHEKGAVVEGAQVGVTTVNVHAPHQFNASDKFLYAESVTNVFMGRVFTVDSKTDDSVTFSGSAFTFPDKSLLVPLGTDSVTANADGSWPVPNYDGSGATIYEDPEGATAVTNAIVNVIPGDYVNFWGNQQTYWLLGIDTKNHVKRVWRDVGSIWGLQSDNKVVTLNEGGPGGTDETLLVLEGNNAVTARVVIRNSQDGAINLTLQSETDDFWNIYSPAGTEDQLRIFHDTAATNPGATYFFGIDTNGDVTIGDELGATPKVMFFDRSTGHFGCKTLTPAGTLDVNGPAKFEPRASEFSDITGASQPCIIMGGDGFASLLSTPANSANNCWNILTTFDSGTERQLYYGGGEDIVAPWATEHYFYIEPTYTQTNDTGHRVLKIADPGDLTHTSPKRAACVMGHLEEEITLNTGGTTTDSAANLLPANSIIMGVTARITTTITTATDWSLGDSAQANRFTAANSTLTAGTTDVGLNHHDPTVASSNLGPVQTSAAKLRITTTGTPGAGAIRVCVFYRQFVAPTS